MATFDHRIGPDGKMVYRVSIRRKGYATQTATFPKLSETKKWAQMTEGSVLEGRHFPIPEAKQHTLADLINRYRHAVLPHKKPSTIKTQRQHLCWWQTHLGPYLLADMTPAVLVEYRSILAHGRANATVVRYLAVLSHAFTMAMREWHRYPSQLQIARSTAYICLISRYEWGFTA